MHFLSSIFFIFLYSSAVFSAEIKIIGPCSPIPTNEKNIVVKDIKDNVGNITVDFLTQEKIPFTGSEFGISSINNSAVGDDALEILSDTKMRAYGWCFTINDKLVDKMPNEIYLTTKQDSIVWFYAYSTYNEGVWSDYCTPAYKLKPSIFCSKK